MQLPGHEKPAHERQTPARHDVICCQQRPPILEVHLEVQRKDEEQEQVGRAVQQAASALPASVFKSLSLLQNPQVP